MWRQGDVLIQVTSEIPKSSAKRNDLVLAEGELTGHVHRVANPDSALLFQDGGDLYLRVTAPEATIVHQEHGPITIATGIYRVWRQREYAPTPIQTNRFRPVRD